LNGAMSLSNFLSKCFVYFSIWDFTQESSYLHCEVWVLCLSVLSVVIKSSSCRLICATWVLQHGTRQLSVTDILSCTLPDMADSYRVLLQRSLAACGLRMLERVLFTRYLSTAAVPRCFRSAYCSFVL